MSLLRLLLLGVILLGLGAPVRAHQVNLSTARVALAADRTVAVEVALKGGDVDRLIGTKIYDATADAVDPAAVDAAAPLILAYFKMHLAVAGSDGSGCAAGTAVILADGDGVIYRNSFACTAVTGDIIYRSTVLTEKDPTARQVVLVAQGESEAQALLDAGNTTVTLSAPAPPLWSTMQRYLLTGIEHILLGYDHIAFLIAVVLWARRLIPVVKIVTAFTIAHSITLSLAALDLVVIPSRMVEPAIAASIMFVAIENFFSRDIDRRWHVAFLFGLIHGFGFAGALHEVGLPTNAIVPALAAFNIGVEIGQVAIVAIVLPVLGLFDELITTGPHQADEGDWAGLCRIRCDQPAQRLLAFHARGGGLTRRGFIIRVFWRCLAAAWQGCAPNGLELACEASLEGRKLAIRCAGNARSLSCPRRHPVSGPATSHTGRVEKLPIRTAWRRSALFPCRG